MTTAGTAAAARGRATLPWMLLAVAGTAAFATGVGARPAGLGWDRFYDVVLYNLPYLFAAMACWVAGARVPAERPAWRALTVALLLNTAGNASRTLAVDAEGTEGVLLARRTVR